jgi:hypothetical protein
MPTVTQRLRFHAGAEAIFGFRDDAAREGTKTLNAACS